jgi:hypothetical protein
VPYGCKLEDLLAILHDRAPAKADAVVLQRRRVEHGLLSVGLKIHYLSKGRQFSSLVERLGGRQESSRSTCTSTRRRRCVWCCRLSGG